MNENETMIPPISNTELYDTLRSLYMVLRDRYHGRMPDEVRVAYENSGELLRRYVA